MMGQLSPVFQYFTSPPLQNMHLAAGREQRPWGPLGRIPAQLLTVGAREGLYFLVALDSGLHPCDSSLLLSGGRPKISGRREGLERSHGGDRVRWKFLLGMSHVPRARLRLEKATTGNCFPSCCSAGGGEEGLAGSFGITFFLACFVLTGMHGRAEHSLGGCNSFSCASASAPASHRSAWWYLRCGIGRRKEGKDLFGGAGLV